MDEQEVLAARFEEHRPRLRAVACRMLGSAAESDEAVQNTWLRLTRSDAGDPANLGRRLTTVVARISLDMLRSREARREDPWEAHLPGPALRHDEGIGSEEQEELTDSVGLALLVVLDTLSPAERLAFVLHDMFAVPFDEIAPVVELTPAATRQLAARARLRVQGTVPDPGTDMARRREVVDAFLAASRGGDFEALSALLDPHVVLRVDPAAALSGAAGAVGAAAVAGTFAGRASGTARPDRRASRRCLDPGRRAEDRHRLHHRGRADRLDRPRRGRRPHRPDGSADPRCVRDRRPAAAPTRRRQASPLPLANERQGLRARSMTSGELNEDGHVAVRVLHRGGTPAAADQVAVHASCHCDGIRSAGATTRGAEGM